MRAALRVGAGLLLGSGVVAGLAGPAMGIMRSDWVVTDDKIWGPLAIEPKTGGLVDPVTITSAGSCPQGTHSITRIYGPKLPPGGENIMANTPIHLLGSPPENRLSGVTSITLDEVGKLQDPPVVLSGHYRMVMDCQIKILADETKAYGFYVGELDIANRQFTSRTPLKALPKVPSPTVGPDAIAYKKYADAAPDPSSIKPDEPENKKNDGSGDMLPIAVAGVIAVLGVGAVVISAKRSASNGGASQSKPKAGAKR